MRGSHFIPLPVTTRGTDRTLKQVPAGCANTRRADRTQVWTDPESHALARDASGEPHSSGRRHGAPHSWRPFMKARHANTAGARRAKSSFIRLRRRRSAPSPTPQRTPTDRLAGAPSRAAHHARCRRGSRRRSAHIKIWTPSETAPAFSRGKMSAGTAAATPQTPSRPSTIPPGSLDAVLQGVRDADRRDRRRSPTTGSARCRRQASPGVLTAQQALARVAHRHRRRLPLHQCAAAVTVQIRVDARTPSR